MGTAVGEAPVPDKHKETKSKYTADRDIPGAFEGETVTRRRFMNVSVNAAGGIAAAAFTLPPLGFALGPLFSRLPFNWQPIGPESDFKPDSYVTRIFTAVQGMGEAGRSLAYVRKRNPDPAIDGPSNDRYAQYIAISSRCMHLGCPVRYTDAAQRFICPCHGGVYDFLGKRTGGPPVRPLDRFYTRVNNGIVELGPRYSVNSELRRYSARDPGQPLDGIGPILYPARFSTPQLK
jgi:Rieske Fe-S protein